MRIRFWSIKGKQLCIDTLVYDEKGSDTFHYNWNADTTDWCLRNGEYWFLNDLVLNCSRIQSLHVFCVNGRLPISTVTKHGSSLQSLTTREYSRWKGAKPKMPTLTDDLDFLDANCSYLESLAKIKWQASVAKGGFQHPLHSHLSAFRRSSNAKVQNSLGFFTHRTHPLGLSHSRALPLRYLRGGKGVSPPFTLGK